MDTEQNNLETDTQTLAEESPEVASVRQELEEKLNAERERRLQAEEGVKMARQLVEQAVTARPQVAQPTQVDDVDAETVKELVSMGYTEEKAAALLRVFARRESKLAGKFVPRDEYARSEQWITHIAVDLDSRRAMESLAEEGYDRASVVAANEQVKKWIAEGKQLGSAEIAFDAAIKKVTKGMKPVNQNDPTLLAREQKKQLQRQADAGDNRVSLKGKGAPPKHLDEIVDDFEWLQEFQKWNGSGR